KIDRLIAGYKQAAKDNNIPLQVNRAGSMVGFFFTDEPVTNFETAQTANTERFGQYYRGMIEGGVFLPPYQFEGLFLSMCLIYEDIDHSIEIVHKEYYTLYLIVCCYLSFLTCFYDFISYTIL